MREWYPDRIKLLGQLRIPGALLLDHKDIKTGRHLPITPSDHYGLLLQLRVNPAGAAAAHATPGEKAQQFFQKRGELRG